MGSHVWSRQPCNAQLWSSRATPDTVATPVAGGISVDARPGRSANPGRGSDRSGSQRRGADRYRPQQARPRQTRSRQTESGHNRAGSTAAPRRRRTGAVPQRGGRWALQLTKVAAAMISALVFCVTGYGWTTFRDLHQGLTTANVIGAATPDKATDILLVGL